MDCLDLRLRRGRLAFMRAAGGANGLPLLACHAAAASDDANDEVAALRKELAEAWSRWSDSTEKFVCWTSQPEVALSVEVSFEAAYIAPQVAQASRSHAENTSATSPNPCPRDIGTRTLGVRCHLCLNATLRCSLAVRPLHELHLQVACQVSAPPAPSVRPRHARLSAPAQSSPRRQGAHGVPPWPRSEHEHRLAKGWAASCPRGSV